MRSSTLNYRSQKGPFSRQMIAVVTFRRATFEIRQWKSGKKSENDGVEPPESVTKRTNWPFQNAM